MYKDGSFTHYSLVVTPITLPSAGRSTKRDTHHNTKCDLIVESHNTFLELEDGKKVLSQGRAVGVPIVTASYSVNTNSTVNNLLHGVDVVLGMT